MRTAGCQAGTGSERRADQIGQRDAVAMLDREPDVAVAGGDVGEVRGQQPTSLNHQTICHPDDVRRAKDYGIDGIYCSNHGGRQANGGLPALDALPDVVTAADGMPVLFDSGVRSGSDVAKALAMGATAVGVGRPYVYALAVGGTDGVVSQLRSLLAELDLLMAIDGLPTVADLVAAGVRRL